MLKKTIQKTYYDGEVRDTYDPRDVQYGDLDRSSKLPKKHITDISMLPVEDQLRNGSCVGQAVAKVVQYFEYKETGEVVDTSARFVYSLAKLGQSDRLTNHGSSPRKAGDVVRKIGCATSETVDDSNKLSHAVYVVVPINTDVLEDAKPRKVRGYVYVDQNKPKEIAQAIYNEGVIACTIRTGSMSRKSGRAKPRSTSGTHHIVLYGYEDRGSKGYKFYFRNSWGKSWGRDGNGYFYYNDYKNIKNKPENVRSVMAYTDVPNSVKKKKQQEAKPFIESEAFTSAMTHLLKWEGGYVNDPRDKGGETKYGISKRAYPTVDIKNLTKEKASFIYKRDYWNASACDKLPRGLDLMIFDTAVNMGVKTAIRMLQEVVGTTQDGIIGNMTLGAMRKMTPNKVLQAYTVLRIQKYTSFAQFSVYGKGWLNRTVDTLSESIKLL